MPARRVTTVTLPVDGRSAVVFESYTGHTPLLTITTARPAMLVSRCGQPLLLLQASAADP